MLKPIAHWKTTDIILLGDAIHSMTPMGEMVANTALRDAELLVRSPYQGSTWRKETFAICT
ncbi:FAD-dependent monooxygenase [Oceanobacillus sp. CFH 90083]|uniref:FAD-dependent monooxygenase n=1 Tax=Oceanobacillus sp. CFH 90083 TaxID=2592336 RepID=UPI003519F9F9